MAFPRILALLLGNHLPVHDVAGSRGRPRLLHPVARKGTAADAPSRRGIDSAIPAELAALVLVPVEGDDEDAAVGNRIEVQEADDGADHLGLGDAVEDEVLVDAKAALCRVSRLGS